MFRAGKSKKAFSDQVSTSFWSQKFQCDSFRKRKKKENVSYESRKRTKDCSYVQPILFVTVRS